MSYCRWSSMNSMCDVYVYADCGGGYTTLVACRRRIIPPIPKPPFDMIVARGAEFDEETCELVYKRKIDKLVAAVTTRLYLWLEKPHNWSLGLIPLKNIGLPHDGESFNHETAAECADNLEYLRGLGYRVPQEAVDALREEIE